MRIHIPKSPRSLYIYVVKHMRVSIYAVVFSFFLFATIVTATVAISLQYLFSRNLATETTLTLFENTTKVTEGYLSEVDERASASARVISQFLHFDANNNLSGESRSLIIEAMRRNPLFHGIYVGFENGDYVGIVNLDADSKTRKALGAEATDSWAMVQITGKDNSRQRTVKLLDSELKITSTRKIDSDFKSQHRPWFIDAVQGKVHKTSPYLFQLLQKPGETYSIKLPSKKAVLGIDITVSSISDYLNSLDTPLDSEMYLFNERGEVTASNQQQAQQISLPIAAKMTMTNDQQSLVESTPYLMVSNELDWPPINFSVSGEPYGYSMDVLNYISQKTGIEMRYVNGLSWNQMAKLFVDNEIDVLQPVYFDPSRKWLGNLSDAFLQVPYGVLTAKGKKTIKHIDELQGKTVAIPEGWLLAENLAEQFPKITIVRVPTVRAMFDAVSEGKVDAAIDTAPILNYIARQYFIDDVTVNTPIEFGEVALPNDLHFMLTKAKPELTSLFNQALAEMDGEYKQALSEKWFPKNDEHREYLGVIPYQKLIKIAQQGGTKELVSIDLNGRSYFAYVTPFGQYNDQNDFFAIVTPADNVLSAAKAKVLDAIIITALVLLLILPLAWLLGRPFIKPIRQLAADSKNIARRRYDEVGEVNSRIAEVQKLAVSMGEMSASIQQHERDQQNLLDAFIKLIAQAIDDKSHHTGGHCDRVPQLALMLLEKANKSESGVFKSFSFDSPEQWREFEVGAWLHDCGKITTPEHIIDKATKLEANYNRIHEIRMRFEVLLRDTEIEYLTKLAEPNSDKAALLVEKYQQQEQLHDDFAFIANANIGGEFMKDEDLNRLKQVSQIRWQRHFDDRLGLSHVELDRYPETEHSLPVEELLLADKPQHRIPRDNNVKFDEKLGIKMEVPEYLYDMGELYNLSVKAGTLTAEDRFKINEHMISTIKMLENLPLPAELTKVPRYASTHHETMIGTGYPRKLSAEELSIPERVMVVADIFEALTAADRPYKKAKTISVSLDILHKMALDQHVDIEIFELFVSSGVYLDYAKKFLNDEQIDEVDTDKYLNN